MAKFFIPLALTAKDAYVFLQEIPIYEQSGILCRIPNWWKNKSSRVKINISVGSSQPNYLGMNALLNFDAQLLLGDQKASASKKS